MLCGLVHVSLGVFLTTLTVYNRCKAKTCFLPRKTSSAGLCLWTSGKTAATTVFMLISLAIAWAKTDFLFFTVSLWPSQAARSLPSFLRLSPEKLLIGPVIQRPMRKSVGLKQAQQDGGLWLGTCFQTSDCIIGLISGLLVSATIFSLASSGLVYPENSPLSCTPHSNIAPSVLQLNRQSIRSYLKSTPTYSQLRW